MSRVCCIENGVVCPKDSSCSMILRSACTHGHSHKKSVVKEHLSSLTSSSHKRKHNTSITAKSYKNQHSLLNGQFHESTVFNHKTKTSQKVLEVSSNNLLCVNELNFSRLSLSDSQDLPVFNRSSIHVECSSDYCSDSDINSSESLDSTSNMITRNYMRSPHPSVRSLSDSEGESDITVQRISRLTRRSLASTEYNTNKNIAHQIETNNISHNASYIGNHSYSTNSRSSNHTGTPDSDTVHSYMTGSADLYAPIPSALYNRYTWSFWSCTYNKLISYVQMDVWLLSRLYRIYEYAKANLLPFILSLLLLLLVLGAYHRSSAMDEESHIPVTTVAVEDRISESSDTSGFSVYFPSLPSSFAVLFSGWFSRAIVQTNYDFTEKHNYHLEDNVNPTQSGAEELLALNALKDELKELKSSFHHIEADKLMYQKLHSDIGDLQLKFEALSKTMDTKERNYIENHQKQNSETDKKIIIAMNEYQNHIDALKNKLKVLENKLGVYEDLKKCCSKQWNQDELLALIERNVISAFREILGGDTNSKYNFFSQWLNSKFFNHDKLVEEIKAALKEQSSYTEATIDFSKVLQVVESTVMRHVDALKRNLSEFNNYSYSTYSQDFFSDDKIRKIVKEAIMLYDADKTGQVDYALESGGGSVLGTRCSETYVEKYGKISLFGVPFWTYSNSPRTAIQPDVQPGRCWAFKGSQGFLVLQLSATIYPTGFTLEHIPVSLSPAGTIDSAPKNFSIWGLDSEKDNKGNLLGEYFYNINEDPLQYFAVKIPSNKPYSYIELQIHSNHGNIDYTCLYRFRVHGKRA